MSDIVLAKPPSTPRTCTRCGEEKTWADFPLSSKYHQKKTGKVVQYVNTQCKVCISEKTREYRKRNPEKVYNTNRRYELRTRYGLTPEEYDELAADGCGICGTHRLLCVDHDHSTGLVRGVLCSKCNRAIGLLGDTKEALERAVAYLS